MTAGLATAFYLLLAAGVAGLCVWLLPKARRYFLRWRRMQRRALLEDVLKHLVTRQMEGREASSETIAGHLSISEPDAVGAVVELEKTGMLHSEGALLRLSQEGQRWALQVLRAHRLWETYLAHEARMPLAKVHRTAEEAEHKLTAGELDELEARLGHPRSDPHGDPIPAANGAVDSTPTHPLTGWPVGRPARIAHIEDEPQVVFEDIASRGLKPGAAIEVVEHSAGHVSVRSEGKEHRLPPALAGSIQVVGAAEACVDRGAWIRLSDLQQGEDAVVVELEASLRGMTRRRLLDLGMTSNARVAKHLDNFFGDPMAYRLRGTTIALRKDQASRIWVRKTSGAREAVKA